MPRIPLLRNQPRATPRLTYSEKKKQRRKIYDSKRWKDLRKLHLMSNPLCKVCELLGIIKTADCCHHVHSFMGCSTEDEFYNVGYDENNLVSLCNKHHSMLHTLDEFSNKTYKRAEDLAEYLKNNPNIDSDFCSDFDATDDENDAENAL